MYTLGPTFEYGEFAKDYVFNVPHKSSTATIEFTSTLNWALSEESWGIRDFFLHYRPCHALCATCNGPAFSQCLSCYTDYFL